MAHSAKKAVRVRFREEVFTRDGFRCRVCGKAGRDRQGGEGHRAIHATMRDDQLVELDAHHIYPRELMPNGGYTKENGISVCESCHLQAEAHWTGASQDPQFSPERLYELIGSSLERALSVG